MAVLLFERDPAAVRIGTYNLRRAKLDDKDPDNNWAAREPRLIQSFLDNDFDICGVQEVDSAEQERLPRLLAERGLRYGVHFFGPYADDGVGTKAHGLLWKEDRFAPAGDPHHFWISDPPEVKQYNDSWRDHPFIRGGFCQILKDLRTGKQLFVMVTHAPLNKEMHAENAHVYVEMEKRYNPQGLPSFFLGDFNAVETDDCSAVYRAVWTDTYHAFDAEPGLRLGPEGTFNGWKLHAVPERRIDFIYYRGKGVTPLCYVCDDSRYGGFYPSDHFPVYADFAIR